MKRAAPPLPPADLEAQIRGSRQRIGAAFEALAERLAPHRLLHQGSGMMPPFRGAGRSERADDAGAELPLLIGLIGLAAGAALAALLPASDGEARLVARTREDLWQAAEAVGHQAAARLRGLCRDTPGPPQRASTFERNG